MEDQAPRTVPQRWVAPALIAVAAALVPWTLLLGYRLPSEHTSYHWDAAWVGFDIAIIVALVATAVGIVRRAWWLEIAAAVAATLLLSDAWFDNILATNTDEHVTAALEAALGEIPLAFVCLWAARNAEQATVAVLSTLRRRR